MNSTKLTNCSFDPNMYVQHETAKTPLYKDADITLLDYIFVEFRKFVSHPSYAKATVSEDFRTDSLFKLPKPNNCPRDFDHAKGLIKDFLIPLQTYHVFKNDCMIFKDEYAAAKECPICGSNHHKSNRKSAKIFKYFPIIPRIARMFQDTNLSQLLQEHSTCTDNGMLKDILDTERWKKDWFSDHGEFQGDLSCVLNFCTDGVNPFRTIGVNYSMWPMMMSVLNFPVSFRKSVGGILF